MSNLTGFVATRAQVYQSVNMNIDNRFSNMSCNYTPGGPPDSWWNILRSSAPNRELFSLCGQGEHFAIFGCIEGWALLIKPIQHKPFNYFDCLCDPFLYSDFNLGCAKNVNFSIVEHVISDHIIYFWLNCEDWVRDKSKVLDVNWTLFDNARTWEAMFNKHMNYGNKTNKMVVKTYWIALS